MRAYQALGLLSISFNDMTHLPESVFAGLVNLEFINMYGFMSEDMPFALPEGLFHGLSGLKELHLGSTPMPEALPEGIFRDLVNLEILNLNGCGDGVAAPVLYSHLKNLERLHLQNNGLSSLPDGYFVGLTKLRKLDLLGNPGAPFELKLELERTDAANAYAPGPATVQAKLATGAPFALSGSVSVLNGSASASGVSVAAGDSIADSFVVNAASAGTSTYVIIEVPETPLNYQGVELKAPEPFVLFAASDDRFPIAQGEIPHYVLQVGGPKATVDLAPYFGEPDGEELTYTVATDASNVGVDIAGKRDDRYLALSGGDDLECEGDRSARAVCVPGDGNDRIARLRPGIVRYRPRVPGAGRRMAERACSRSRRPMETDFGRRSSRCSREGARPLRARR